MQTLTTCLLTTAVLATGSACHRHKAPDVQWSRTFASVDTSARWIQQTNDGGFVVAGRILPNREHVPWDVDMYLLRLDSRGNTVWQDTYSSGETHDYALSVQQTSDGGFVLAGMGGHDASVIVVKTDSTGTREWDFTGFPGATIYNIQQTADGGYITAGLWSRFDSLYLLKLDSQGKVTWRRCYDEFYGHWRAAIPVQQTTDGGFIVAAEALLRTDGDGNQRWKYRYPGVLVMFSVQQTSDGGFISAGLARQPWPLGHLRRFAMVLLKTDSAGVLTWKRIFAAGQESGGRCARQTQDGGYIVCGYVTSGDTSRATIISTDRRGNPLWKKTLPGPTSIDNAQQTSDGGYILCQGSRHIWKLAPDRTR